MIKACGYDYHNAEINDNDVNDDEDCGEDNTNNHGITSQICMSWLLMILLSTVPSSPSDHDDNLNSLDDG